jgi:hypothetical protein
MQSMPPYVPEDRAVATRTQSAPQTAEDDERERDQRRAEASLDSIVFLFQLLMAFAITNAAYLFFTDGGNTYTLRGWDTYTPFGIIAFLAFGTLIIPFIHADVLVLKESYAKGFTDKGLWPLTDFFLLFLHAALFYALSHTFATLSRDPMDFFYLVGGILSLNVFWAMLGVVIEFKQRKVVIKYVIQNTLAVAAGGYILWARPPHMVGLLLAVLVVRNLVDFAITYNFLFPRAFQFGRGHRH